MCTADRRPLPRNADEATDLVPALLRWLAEADVRELPAAVQAECLRKLEDARSVHAAAHAGILSAFDRAEGYADDGQGSARTWLRRPSMPTGRRRCEVPTARKSSAVTARPASPPSAIWCTERKITGSRGSLCADHGSGSRSSALFR